MLNDPLANALAVVSHSEKLGRKECCIKPVSKIIKTVLNIMKDARYTGEFEEIDDGKGGFLKLHLLGNINKCGVIKPRFAVKKDEFVKFEKRFLPAKDFGMLIVSTSKGLLVQDEAKKNNLGGKLIAFCY